MPAAALLMGFAMFFFAPVVPWLLFPMHRRAGAAAAAVCVGSQRHDLRRWPVVGR